MRFKNLSETAIRELWDEWKYPIRDLLYEFNDDVFKGMGRVRENRYHEFLYLLLETKVGCLYILPLPDYRIALRVFRHKIEKVDADSMPALNRTEKENYVGGIRVVIGRTEDRDNRTRRFVRNKIEKALKGVYKKHWEKLLY